MPGRFSWLGGKPDPKADAASIRRARRHQRNAAKADREGQRWEDRDRRTYGG